MTEAMVLNGRMIGEEDDVTELVEIGGETSLDFKCRKGLWFTWVAEQADPMASRYFKDFQER